MAKTQIISVPVDRLDAVCALLGRRVAENQTPIVKIRVPTKLVKTVRKVIKNA